MIPVIAIIGSAQLDRTYTPTAGAIAFLLFVAAQLSTNPDLLASERARQLVFFVLAVGFIGGFTSETVYRKLQSQDVAQTSVLLPAGG
jgi:hypothetical protein